MSRDINHEAHEDREGYELDRLRYRMRLASPLDAHAEATMTETIGCAIRVHRELGPGFLESIYRKAMCLEQAAGISYESERPVCVKYRDVLISGQRVA